MDIITADATIPQIGLGTWQVTGPDCADIVAQALRDGYRHVDTAQMYGNEEEVGRGIADSGVARGDIWLTTKLDNDFHKPDEVRRTLQDSLRKLQTDYVDLFLIHWPVDVGILEDTLGAMEELRKNGDIRHIGVSNFTAEQLSRAAEATTVVTNQVEHHVFLGQDPLRGVADARGIALTAYSPLAQGKVIDNPVLREIANVRGATPPQIALRWLLDNGNIVIPRSSSSEHVRANFAAGDLEPLTEEEMDKIDALPKDQRLIDPPFAPDWDR